MITRAIGNIFRVNLNVKRSENVLIFTDRPVEGEVIEDTDRCRRERLRDIAILASEIGKGFCKNLFYRENAATGSHGAEPPPELWAIAFGEKEFKTLKAENLLIRLIKKKATEPDMKRGKARYASMPLFDASMLEGAMNVDWKTLDRRTRDIARVVNMADIIEVKTLNGTDISFSKKGRRAESDTGILTKPGSFGNLPAGEVYLAPLEGTADGRLVLEWAPTRPLKSPITLKVENGLVKKISGNETYTDYLKAKISEQKENANIAELGIGTNDMAKRPDNILESEKILGTIHFALGDNSSFGGKVSTPFHQDFVFFRPTVTLIYKDSTRKVLMKGGKFVIEERLAGCVNIVKNIRSIYNWQGKIEDEPEVLMIVKTQRNLFDKLFKKVKELHSYTVPEIIAVPIVEGSEDYLKWLKEVID
ncbi:MAG: divalent cation tolerance protein CutA [Nitrospirae bacterium]|nr:divalent cation tolerance protein CutA [Nitrospirota bacterium]